MTARETRVFFITILFISSMFFMVSCVNLCEDIVCGVNEICKNGICVCEDGYIRIDDLCEQSPLGDLIGTWNAITINGQPFAEGVWLRWTFTETTLTITSDYDCIETMTYTATGNEITSTIISLEGSQCDGQIGETGTISYELNENTLTITITDPELGIGIFVFVRV